MRGLFVYMVYVVVVSTALLHAVSTIGANAAVADVPPTAHSTVSVSLIDGSPEHTVFCSKATNTIGADMLVLHSQADLEKLLRDLGCAPP